MLAYKRNCWTVLGPLISALALMTIPPPVAVAGSVGSATVQEQTPVKSPLKSALKKSPAKSPPVETSHNRTSIYGTAWGLTLELDGTGFYNDIAKRVFPELGDRAVYEIMPYGRSKQAFFKDEDSCLYPNAASVLIAGDEMHQPEDFIESNSFVLVQSFLFSAKGVARYDGSMSLKGKIVAHPIGSALPKLLEGSDADFVAISDELVKARLLMTGRVDYMSSTLPDSAFVFNALRQEVPGAANRYRLFSSGIGVVCHKTPENIALIERLNAAFLHQYRAGNLQPYLIDAGLDPAEYLPKIE